MHKKLPIRYLRECFSYNQRTGLLTWKTRPLRHFSVSRGWSNFNLQFAGEVAGSLADNGYIIVRLAGLGLVKAHRIIWAVYYGEDPGQFEVDHKDTDRSNNRIKNLRLATKAQNMHNQGLRKTNSSGIKGVSWTANVSKWHAAIRINGRSENLGYYDDIDVAARVVRNARRKLHKEFARH